MRITSKGQVTIPFGIREEAGFLPNTEVDFRIEGKRVVLEKAKGRSMRGKDLVDRIKGKATVSMSTDEIMALTRG